MKKYLFLFKLNNTEDRDCCAYVENKTPSRDCCGSIIFHGACYYGSNKIFYDYDYEDFTTILNKEEFEFIMKADKSKAFQDDNCEMLIKIYEKLRSVENEYMLKKIQLEEQEYLKETYNLKNEDIDKIFSEYALDYRDRAIVGCIYEDTYDLGYNEAFSLGYIKLDDSILEKYFNFEKFGEDLLEDEEYILLSDNRIARLNY